MGAGFAVPPIFVVRALPFPKCKFKLLFCKNSFGGDVHSPERLLVLLL